jgi:hypothetical protein
MIEPTSSILSASRVALSRRKLHFSPQNRRPRTAFLPLIYYSSSFLAALCNLILVRNANYHLYDRDVVVADAIKFLVRSIQTNIHMEGS